MYDERDDVRIAMVLPKPRQHAMQLVALVGVGGGWVGGESGLFKNCIVPLQLLAIIERGHVCFC
jgi:hypothetical protein